MIATDVPHIATYLLEKYGLLQQGWSFAWDNARRRAGACHYGTKRVTLSRHFVALNVADKPEEVMDTILHEVAHALAPGNHHGDEWKAACVLVGAKPQRCYDSKEVAMPQGKYVATCGGCGNQYRRHKAPKRRHYCIKCGPTVGLLTFRHEDQIPQPVPATSHIPPPPRRLRG